MLAAMTAAPLRGFLVLFVCCFIKLIKLYVCDHIGLRMLISFCTTAFWQFVIKRIRYVVKRLLVRIGGLLQTSCKNIDALGYISLLGAGSGTLWNGMPYRHVFILRETVLSLVV